MNESRKPNGYWNNYDNCINEAKKYKTIEDFIIGSPGAYKGAKKNGWIKDCNFEKIKPTYHGKRWTFDICEKEAKKYKSLVEFKRGNRLAYVASVKHKWIDSFTWLSKHICKPRGYWNYDRCLEESKKYTTKRDFSKGCVTAYNVSLKNGWLKDFTWIKPATVRKIDNSGQIYLIYGYFDEENKKCYIGLTRQLKRRHESHKIKTKGSYDVVMKYFISLGKQLPDPTILEDNLTAEQAQEKEGYYVEYYKNNGYELLNIAKTGSLGSIPPKWTEDVCLAEAKKYNSRKEFEEGNLGAYSASLRNEWMDNYTWFKPKTSKESNYWTEERCIEVARKCKTLYEFNRDYTGAYASSRKNGWIDNYTWLARTIQKPTGYWNNEELCLKLAKECISRSDFKNRYNEAYRSSLRNKWIDNYMWFKDPIKPAQHPAGYWTKEHCIEESKKYKTMKEFKKDCKSGAYKASKKNNWLDDFTWLEKD